MKDFITENIKWIVGDGKHISFWHDWWVAQKDIKLTSWNFLPASFVKLNTDGAAKRNPRNVGFGGIYKDNQGKWLARYYEKLGTSISLIAELWSIRIGIRIAKGQDYNKQSYSKMTTRAQK